MRAARLTMLLLATTSCAAREAPRLAASQDARPASSQPADSHRQPAAAPQESDSRIEAPRPPAPFQPGVAIDWAAKTVRVEGEVVLRGGPLEFFACLPGREHESIVRLKASAVHIYMALGLVGAAPGHPPVWNEREVRFEPATGDLVEVAVEWREGDEVRRAPAFDWLRDTRYARPVAPRPWLFAGSLPTGDGGLEADLSGRLIALVDFSENLLTLSRGHVSQDADLWAEANEPAIPPRKTAVTLLLSPARHRPRTAEMDFRGDLHLDGLAVAPEDFADVVLLERRLSPRCVQVVSAGDALASDIERARSTLRSLGLPEEATRFERQDGP